MTNDPVDLDERRDIRAQKAMDIRQRLQEFQDDLETSKRLQRELENLLFATQARTWPEAAEKALYLLQLFSATPEAQDPGCKERIKQTLLDLNRLRTRPQDSS